MKLDTRDKKPKLWAVLIEAVLVILAVALLLRADPKKNAPVIGVLISVFQFVVLIQLVVAFIRQVQYNLYSYNTIFYMGFALFLLVIWVQQVWLTVLMIRDPETYTADQVLSLLLGSGKNYMLLTAPFVLLFSAALFISNVSLIRHEGKRLVNVLGIILSFLLVAGEIIVFRLDYYATGSQFEVMMHDLFTNLLAAVYLYFECMLIGIIVAASIAARYEPEKDKDFLIILGCGIRKDGTPSPLLRGRIDRAIAFAKQQKAETGKDLIFVTSGGQGPNEVIPESTSMKRYMVEQGIPEERIIEEGQSTNTLENMRFSKEKILAAGGPGKVAFSTTNYHVFRSGLCARRVKMRAVGMGAKTKWYFWPNAAVREFVGLLTEHRGKQALIFGGMIVFYVALTILAYQ